MEVGVGVGGDGGVKVDARLVVWAVEVSAVVSKLTPGGVEEAVEVAIVVSKVMLGVEEETVVRMVVRMSVVGLEVVVRAEIVDEAVIDVSKVVGSLVNAIIKKTTMVFK